ncbi:hypothetical protein CDL15_Pgr014500 [Punica granatum]|uniref:Myb/SANT-like domain-containing protein n=1 Tax=Punica granatum TaxID=22663 RepID=A0A218WD75_PUNGR|nr:hypothetical protein CDL15_Pgr014500 [Punica granatum]
MLCNPPQSAPFLPPAPLPSLIDNEAVQPNLSTPVSFACNRAPSPNSSVSSPVSLSSKGIRLNSGPYHCHLFLKGSIAVSRFHTQIQEVALFLADFLQGILRSSAFEWFCNRAYLLYRYFSATEMAPKGDGIVEWTDELESAFVDIMVDKFQRTHTSSWKMKDWEQISKELEEKFPGVILGADKVKTKAQRMKTQYTQFTELIQHTGVGWDAPTNTVKANLDIWDKFIKRHSNFRTFRSKGCKHYEALQLIYKTSSATGGLRISSTDPPHSPRSYARIEEEF